jgi:two-component system, sensor histidine kinase LadS
VALFRALLILVTSLTASLALLPSRALAAEPGGDVTLQAHYWTDDTGALGIDEVANGASTRFLPMEKFRTFTLNGAALWLRLDLPALDSANRWHLLLSAAAFTDKATFYQRDARGGWMVQQAGDHLPVAQWSHKDQTPVFALSGHAPGSVWLRLENRPAPMSPRLQLLTEGQLQEQRYWTYLLLGAYLGLGVLVAFLGWVHVRLYGDRVFLAYVCYVLTMLGFQLAFTGIGGLFFWPHWARWNDAAPALFMLWLTASGIWFVREACAVQRYHRGVDRAVIAWCLFGLVYPVVYLWMQNSAAFLVLNLYGLLSVVLSIFLCIWTWRQGQAYAGWLALGFLPVHLGYPFPALRSAGILPDSWATQYAVLIGSAIEIPLLLYILHRRAKDFGENRARMRAIDVTDPLTGLAVAPVLYLRLRDAWRRAARSAHQCGVLLVELSNHPEIYAKAGREAVDRSLVVAASRLLSVVGEVDTVSRIADHRFAILMEGPPHEDIVKALAQHIVAKGLDEVPTLPGTLVLRFRVAFAWLPEDTPEDASQGGFDEHGLLERLNRVLDYLAGDPKRSILRLPGQVTAHSES